MTPVEIKLYQTASEPTMVEKTLVEKATVTGYFKQVQDITAPVIDLAFNDRDTFDLYFNSNYAYIALFNRYYFISRKEVGMNNILSIYMDEDVLMSFKNEIYELVPLVTRQENATDNTIIDNAIPISTKPKISVILGSYFKWGTVTSKTVAGIEYIDYIANTGENFFTFKGTISVQCFTKVKGTSADNYCNGMVSSNRYYNMDMNTFDTMYEAITAPDFWGSVKNDWFTDYSQSIMDIKMLPFDVSKNPIYTFTKQNEIQFMLGNYKIPDNGTAILMNPSMYFVSSCELHWAFDTNNFITYMSTYEAVLPYLGKIELPAQLLSRFAVNNECHIYAYLIINPSTWKGKYIIHADNKLKFICPENDRERAYLLPITKGNIIYESDYFDVGSSVPMGSTDKNQKNLGFLTTGLSIAAGVATGGIAGGILGALGGDMSPATAKAQKRTQDKRLRQGSLKYNQRMSEYQSSLTKDIASAGITFGSNLLGDVLPLLSNSSSIISSATTGSDYYSLAGAVYTFKTEPIPVIPDNYYQLYGKPCNLTVPLSTLKTKGYTKCANVHMTGFTNATSEEISEIESLLLSGVIL